MKIPSKYIRALSGTFGGALAQSFGALNSAAIGRSSFAGIGGNDCPRGTPITSFLCRLLILSLFVVFALQATAAHAQANIHNAPAPLNTAQNTSTTASGTLTARGSDAVGSLPYNGAQFNFAYTVASTGNWSGGIQYQVQGGKKMIWVQPANVTFPNATSNGTDFASYTMTWTRGVLGLTFRVGGLDFNDGVRVQFLNNGVAYNINSSWVTATSVETGNALAVSSISPTQLRVASTLPLGFSGDTSLNYAQFTAPAGVIVDEVRVIAAKEAGLVSNNTIGFHDFNWLPLAIDAVNDTATGINGVTGQANVINVLANDTLNDPDTVGVDAATLTTVTVSQVSTTNVGVTLNPATGQISVAAGTAPGVHVVTYQICEKNTAPANCATATATVTVAASIVPGAETGTAVSGTASTPVANVRSNDTVNGAAATSANSTIAQSGTWPAGISLNTTTGAISTTAAVAPGTYSIAYELCDRNTPANCATVTDTITVTAPQVDLAITKTNGVTTVVSGTTTTYAITITNNGPDAVTGAVVTDIPGSGIICPSTNPVTIAGSGVPTGSFSVGNLTGAGIVLQTVPSGGSTTLTFSCEVN